MRSEKEIQAEIAALKLCKTYAPRRTVFGDDNYRRIDLQIEFLKGHIDTTAGEFDEMSDDDQSTIFEAEQWRDGLLEQTPSSGWDIHKPKACAACAPRKPLGLPGGHKQTLGRTIKAKKK